MPSTVKFSADAFPLMVMARIPFSDATSRLPAPGSPDRPARSITPGTSFM
jgi:hypothetical protein